ncbi:hypothetical protein, partial [Immundisolibacter sp.]|uniref:hypothetical protein n=1 Tax=Immundisolibacter sp. TaxID=1934948 RepID=UPI003F86B81C
LARHFALHETPQLVAQQADVFGFGQFQHGDLRRKCCLGATGSIRRRCGTGTYRQLNAAQALS